MDPAAMETINELAGSTSFDPAVLSPTEQWTQIGDGGYSAVFEADWFGTTVAIKRTADKKVTAKLALLRELRLMRLAGPHPNLVQVMGVFEEDQRLHAVLEYVPYTLRSTEIVLAVDPVTVIADIVRALVHIHRLDIVHRDIKARNVLITSASRSARARLIDFGLACSLKHDTHEWLCRSVGTKSYRPPEMKQRGRAHGSQDIYSLGVMLLKLAKKLPRHTTEDQKDYKILSHVASECRILEPESRPEASQILVELLHHMNTRCVIGQEPSVPRQSISWTQEIALEKDEQRREDARHQKLCTTTTQPRGLMGSTDEDGTAEPPDLDAHLKRARPASLVDEEDPRYRPGAAAEDQVLDVGTSEKSNSRNPQTDE